MYTANIELCQTYKSPYCKKGMIVDKQLVTIFLLHEKLLLYGMLFFSSSLG